MSKPIIMTEEMIEEAAEKFKSNLKKQKLFDGKLKYEEEYVYKEEEKAIIWFEPMAYAKMLTTIMAFESEVAWHCVVDRVPDKSNEFVISDILIYPQLAAGATVEMDEDKCILWRMENMNDPRFSKMYGPGHSHVNMSVFASGTDLEHQKFILKQISNEQFYIFMIWNKKLENTTMIYDLKENVFYDKKEIEYRIIGEDFREFLKSAKEMVAKKPVATTSYYQQSYNKTATPVKSPYPEPQSASKKEDDKTKSSAKPTIGNGWRGKGMKSMDENGFDAYDYAGVYY